MKKIYLLLILFCSFLSSQLIAQCKTDVTAYQDADGDGYGNPQVSQTFNACAVPFGWVLDFHDCDDTDPNIHPGAREIPGDNKDNDCDGQVDETDPLIFYVKPTGSDGNNGLSWAAAFRTLQMALSQAISGDQIWVAAGTYYPDEGAGFINNDINASFSLKNDVAIYGGFAGNEAVISQRNPQTNITILSGEIQQDGNSPNNAVHVVQSSGVGSGAVLDGFTITAGGNLSVPGSNGAGMFNTSGASPSITNCIFSNNNATVKGGGLYNETSSSPLMTNCSFTRNLAQQGGAIANENASLRLNGCSFTANNLFGGGQLGGAIFNNNAGLTIIKNCRFSGNTAPTGSGGAIYNSNATSGIVTSTLTNCIFYDNGATRGGAIYNIFSSPTLYNCSFSMNRDSSIGNGGAFYNIDNSLPNLTNCILWGDIAGGISGGEFSDNSNTITYSIVQGGYTGTGNKNQDPEFVNATNGDLHLLPCSPAINAGIATSQTPATDIEGNTRSNIDMGAYEFMGAATTFYQDLDGDGYGNPNVSTQQCPPPPGYVLNNTDCDDSKLLYADNDGDGYGAGLPVACGVANNSDCDDTKVLYADNDGDGFGTGSLVACGGVANNSDCDDTKVLYADNDGDGFGAGSPVACGVANNSDCDDSNKDISPLTVWSKDADNDGYSDGTTATQCTRPMSYKLSSELTATNGDCDDNNPSLNPTTVWYKDVDNDNYSDGTIATQCARPAGYKLASELTATSGDCDDNNGVLNPTTKWYKDADNDGYSDGITATQCARPTNYKLSSELTATTGDCDDNNATLNPSTKWYKDADGDGYSDGITATQCTRPTAYKLASELTAIAGDCNDNDATVHSLQIYYLDADQDGYGNPVKPTSVCSSTPPSGYVNNNKDCNDSDPAISPTAVEVCGNKVDDNCNNVVDEKATCYPCQNGTNLTSSNITSSSVQLNWKATANPQQWQLEYKSVAPGAKWVDVFLTGNIRSAKISSLKAIQSYNWHIRAKCNGSWTSYSTTMSFKTAASGLNAQEISSVNVANNSIMKLYPNPTKGQFVLDLHVADKINGSTKIQLLDMTGKTVQTENATFTNGILQKTITMSSALTKGIYMVRIIVNDKVYKTQLVYEK